MMLITDSFQNIKEEELELDHNRINVASGIDIRD